MPELTVVAEANVALFGTSLSEAGISSVIAEKQGDLERMVSRLELIENRQALTLLKNIFFLTKI